MKALILAAGRGKRMDDLTHEVNKCRVVIHGKPLIEYSLDNIATINAINEIVIVVGYQAESIINQYGITYKEKKIQYCIQDHQNGLVNAIETARPFIDNDDFFLFLGDEIVLGVNYNEMIDDFYTSNATVSCGVVRQPELSQIKKTYSIFQNDENRIFRLVEKPKNPFNDIMGTGNCIFRNMMLEYIPIVPIHYIRKEKELPDFIQCAIDDGLLVKSHYFCEYYMNANTKEELQQLEKNWPKKFKNKENECLQNIK